MNESLGFLQRNISVSVCAWNPTISQPIPNFRIYFPFAATDAPLMIRSSPTGDRRHRKRSKFPRSGPGVPDYTYRYYDPLTGRWPSRDPIGDLFGIRPELLIEGPSLYAFLGNRAINFLDLLGLAGLEIVRGESNCLGHAASGGRGDVSVFPRPDGTKDDFIDLMKQNGWKCKKLKDRSKCKCKCEEEQMMVTLWKNDNPRNENKDPWSDHDFDWSNDGSGKVSDLHAVYSPSGCNPNFTEIMGHKDFPRKPDSVKDWDLFDKHSKSNILCCCKKKELIVLCDSRLHVFFVS